MRRAPLAGLLALLMTAPCGVSAASPARLLGNAGALEGARVGSPLTVRVAGSGVTSVRYVLDGHYLGKTSTAPFLWRIAATTGEHESKARLEGAPGSLTATFTVARGVVPSVPAAPSAGLTRKGQDVYVRGSEALAAALARARPGETIHLADGVYTGRTRAGHYTGSFVVTRSGSPAAPITLTGGRRALIDGGGSAGHYGLYVAGASWWRFRGFTVANASKGVVSDRGLYGIWIQGRNTIGCGNSVRGASQGLANVPCANETIRSSGGA